VVTSVYCCRIKGHDDKHAYHAWEVDGRHTVPFVTWTDEQATNDPSAWICEKGEKLRSAPALARGETELPPCPGKKPKR